MEIDHLSYSSISTYLNCARQWRYKYVDKVETPGSDSLFLGSVFHKCVEIYLQLKIEGQFQPLPECWQAAWQQQQEQYQAQPDEATYQEGVRLTSQPEILKFVNALRPMITDEGPQIEKYIELHAPGVPVPVIGYIDMIGVDGIPCDFKTANRSWSSSKAQLELQPVFYLTALNQMGYQLNPDLKFRHYVFVKSNPVKIEIWETTRTVKDMFWLLDTIKEVWRAIEAGVYPPTKPDNWLCSPRYCPYWATCKG